MTDEALGDDGSQRPAGRWAGMRGLQGSLGWLATGWWIDRPALAGVVRFLFPLSRVWAAADLADGDVARLAHAVPMPIPGWLRGRTEQALAKVREARAAAQAAIEARNALFWSCDAPAAERLQAEESRRIAATDRYMNSRVSFWHLRAFGKPPPLRLHVKTPDEVHGEIGDAARETAAWFAPPDGDAIEASHTIRVSATREDCWLRLRSPVLGDSYTVRVRAPVGVTDPPTVIYGSGVGMETDLWCDPLDDFAAFLDRGMRVVELCSPWHGVRRLPGWWSGEPFFGTAPLGPITLFRAQALEIAALTAWARRTSAGPVALAGVSLGALAAQVAASASADWPKAQQADAMLLLTTAERLDRLTFDSALARGLGLDRALTAAGWTLPLLAPLRPLTDPVRTPPMGGGNIVMVLGTEDAVTPYASGAATAERWCVPEANMFVGKRGHFSTPINALRDQRPLDRLAALLRGA
ncbi:MAG: hypothetical protein R3F55_19005 [Alphaproteobacteria bacterium]